MIWFNADSLSKGLWVLWVCQTAQNWPRVFFGGGFLKGFYAVYKAVVPTSNPRISVQCPPQFGTSDTASPGQIPKPKHSSCEGIREPLLAMCISIFKPKPHGP